MNCFILLLTLGACMGENAGVTRAKAEAAELEAAEVARIKQVRTKLDPVIAQSVSADLVLRGYINVGDACAFLIDPQMPTDCADKAIPGKCWGALFELQKDGWKLVGSGNRDQIVFPPRCHVGLIVGDDFRHVGDLTKVGS